MTQLHLALTILMTIASAFGAGMALGAILTNKHWQQYHQQRNQPKPTSTKARVAMQRKQASRGVVAPRITAAIQQAKHLLQKGTNKS
jgi:hypothetical protein